MPYLDNNWVFGLPAITTSNTATISTNVCDVGSAKIVFGAPFCGYVCFETVGLTAGTSTLSIKVDLVAASNADLVTNTAGVPIVLGSSGVITTDETGATLTLNAPVRCKFPVGGQTASRQFYGLFVTLGGTNPSMVAAAKQGYFTTYPQTMMENERAAVP